jgi:hypothetical protein
VIELDLGTCAAVVAAAAATITVFQAWRMLKKQHTANEMSKRMLQLQAAADERTTRQVFDVELGRYGLAPDGAPFVDIKVTNQCGETHSIDGVALFDGEGQLLARASGSRRPISPNGFDMIRVEHPVKTIDRVVSSKVRTMGGVEVDARLTFTKDLRP